MELSPAHLLLMLFLLIFIFGFCLVIPLLAYYHGRKVGDQAGYIRGYKEGQDTKEPK